MQQYTYIFQKGLLYPAFDDTCGLYIVLFVEIASDDWRAYCRRSVNDFFDSRHTLSNMHVGDTSKMKSFQSHLRAWFPDRLGADCANGRPGFNLSLLVLPEAGIDEPHQSRPRHFGHLFDVLFGFLHCTKSDKTVNGRTSQAYALLLIPRYWTSRNRQVRQIAFGFLQSHAPCET